MASYQLAALRRSASAAALIEGVGIDFFSKDPVYNSKQEFNRCTDVLFRALLRHLAEHFCGEVHDLRAGVGCISIIRAAQAG